MLWLAYSNIGGLAWAKGEDSGRELSREFSKYFEFNLSSLKIWKRERARKGSDWKSISCKKAEALKSNEKRDSQRSECYMQNDSQFEDSP